MRQGDKETRKNEEVDIVRPRRYRLVGEAYMMVLAVRRQGSTQSGQARMALCIIALFKHG